MRRHLPTVLLMLTTTCGLAAAADPPAKPVRETTASSLDPFAPVATSKPKSDRPSTDPTPTNQVVANTPKAADPGYTQIGSLFKLKLDRPKTQLSLYENSAYSIYAKRDDVGMIGVPNPQLIVITDTDGNGISFNTVRPGVATLAFLDDLGKQYLVEITIIGDTRQLQSQLDKLYPQASIQAIKVGDSVLLRGTVAKPENVNEIVEIAEQFYPRALNQLKVAGPPVSGPGPGQTRNTPVYGLSQSKPTGAPVYQSRLVYPVAPVPHTVYGKPQPRLAPTWGRPVSPAKTTKPQIMIQAVVLEIDWKRLAESKLDLANTIRAFATDPEQRNPRSNELPFIRVAVPQTTTDGIVRLLKSTGAVKVIGSPNIATLVGRPAELKFGVRIPNIDRREIGNGKQQLIANGYRFLGTALKLTPESVSNDGIKLSVVVEHSQRVGSTGAHTAGGIAVPIVRIHNRDLMFKLKTGQSIILAETGPVAVKDKNQTVGKGLVVILSPSIVGTTPTAQRAPVKTGVANVVRFNSFNQVDLPAPWPVRAATFIPQAKPQDLQQSVRELRSDVRALRQDVGRLLKLLEKKETARKELRQSKASPAEQKIQKALEKHASLQFEKMPLADAIRVLSQNANLSIVLDQRGLEEEGVTGKTPVTIHADGLMLKSGLNLMLQHLNLAYQIRDEVLVITSQQRAEGPMIVVTYPVADLVIPIPTAGPVPIDENAAGEDKGALIDFDTLTETILSTVQPNSWNQVGGRAAIQPFKTTLSLVIRQTPEAHKEIAELIVQLRLLQDLQVTLESRFLDKLPEDVWKRIGFDSPRDAAKKDSNGKVRRDVPLGGIILTDQQVKLLLQVAQNHERANIFQAPKVTLFNAQTANIANITLGNKQQPFRHSLHVQPVISADRRNVRLSMRVSDRESPQTDTRAYVSTVPDGKTLLIEIGRSDATIHRVPNGVPILQKVPYITRLLFKNTRVAKPDGRQFLLIRPRVIVQEEEEELLGIEK